MDSIPLPSVLNKNNKAYSMKDVIRAINIITNFLRYKEKIDNIINYFSANGLTLDFSVLNNPNMLMRQLFNLKMKNSNVDVDSIINELNSLADLKLDEVEEAINIIKSFISISRNVSSILSVLSKNTSTTLKEIELLRNLFNIKQDDRKIEEEDMKEVEISEDIRKEIRRILKEG